MVHKGVPLCLGREQEWSEKSKNLVYFFSYSQGQPEENFTIVFLNPAYCKNQGENEKSMLRV